MHGDINFHLRERTMQTRVNEDAHCLTIEFYPADSLIEEFGIRIFARNLDQIRDLGQSIVDACERIEPTTPPSILSDAVQGHDFVEPTAAFIPGSRNPQSLGEEYGDPGIDKQQFLPGDVPF